MHARMHAHMHARTHVPHARMHARTHCTHARMHVPHAHTHTQHLTLPVSTTYFISGIVRDVSATLVATTHSRTPSGGGLNTLGRLRTPNSKSNSESPSLLPSLSLCVCVCVCMCVCMRACMRTCVCVPLCLFVCVHHVNTQYMCLWVSGVCLCVYMYTHVCGHVYRTCTPMHASRQTLSASAHHRLPLA